MKANFRVLKYNDYRDCKGWHSGLQGCSSSRGSRLKDCKTLAKLQGKLTLNRNITYNVDEDETVELSVIYVSFRLLCSYKPIVDYIDTQFENFLQEEMKIKRSLHNYHDSRIHICLYFIAPTGHSLKSLDLVTMKKLDSKVNYAPPQLFFNCTLVLYVSLLWERDSYTVTTTWLWSPNFHALTSYGYQPHGCKLDMHLLGHVILGRHYLKKCLGLNSIIFIN